MSNTQSGITLLFIFISVLVMCSSSGQKYKTLIDAGEFTQAREQIEQILAENTILSAEEKSELLFEIERMERISKDFNKTEDEVLAYIKQYIPEVAEEDMARWEAEKSLEYKLIDGGKRYFNYAARNLFRINKECREIWDKHHPSEVDAKKPEGALDLAEHNFQIIEEVKKTGKRYVSPVHMRITYNLSVKPNMVPDGEIIRCWIPFPREIPERQQDIVLHKTEPAQYILAPGDQLQRTIYFEKPAKANESTDFMVEYEYTNHGAYIAIDPEKVVPVNRNGELAQYLAERPPHIVFSKKLRKISKEIVGTETNPYRIAQELFEWANTNIPWASAREYSTFRNISDYCIDNMHGDCGIQSLLFITLCRMNGIPTRWQSGWNFTPPDDSMHDWGKIYFEPYGWIPMDVYYGPQESEDEQLKWFFLSGMDSYRLVFNDDYSQQFFPKKKHFRSETIDSQRGEVEWDGGNLYFDKWAWDMKWQVMESR